MKNKRFKKISVIIPTYNEYHTIRKILRRVAKADSCGLAKEIIIVDDGSTDGTRDLLKKELAKKVKVEFHDQNYGKGIAIQTALNNSSGDLILIQDADLEYDPGDYPKLITPIIKGKAQVVYGSRNLSGKNKYSSFLYYGGGKLMTLLTNLLFNSNLSDIHTGYKVFEKNVLINLPLKSKGFEFCPEVTAMLLKRNIPIHEVEINYFPRKRNEGKKIQITDGIIAAQVLIQQRINKKIA